MDVNLTGSISGPGGSDSRGGEIEIFAEGDDALTGAIDLSGGFDGGLLFIEALDSVSLGPNLSLWSHQTISGIVGLRTRMRAALSTQKTSAQP